MFYSYQSQTMYIVGSVDGIYYKIENDFSTFYSCKKMSYVCYDVICAICPLFATIIIE